MIYREARDLSLGDRIMSTGKVWIVIDVETKGNQTELQVERFTGDFLRAETWTGPSDDQYQLAEEKK